MKWMTAMAGVSAILAGWATAASAAAEHRVGRIYSYVRSNQDGTEAEKVHVFRASPTRVEVTKMRDKCENAALVTADLDLESGQATRLTGGRLKPGATHEEFAFLTYDREARRIDAVVRLPDGELRDSVEVKDEPWHLYDFDLASLTITSQYRAQPKADFSFGLPLILVRQEPGDFLTYLGRADARFVREETFEGRPALRFEVGGPAFGDKGGPLWIDAEQGHVLGADWGIPNHVEYRDFRLRLTGVSDEGEAAWKKVLTAHFEGCPEEPRA